MAFNRSVAQFKTDMTQLSNTLGKNFHQTTLAMADELIGNMKSRLSVETVRTGTLRDSVRKRDVSKLPEKASVLVLAGGRSTTHRGHDYALDVEFGTRKMPAEPFFYVSYREYSRNGIEQYKETLAETIAENNRVRAARSNNYTAGSLTSGSLSKTVTRSVTTRGAIVIQRR